MYFLRRLIVKFTSQIAKLRFRFKKDNALQGPPKSGMDKETVLKRMAKISYWWHSLELGYGIVTPGHHGGIHHPSGDKALLEKMKLPSDLTGKSVLDIGAWDGFYSFEAEKRGANKVVAIDNFYRDDLEWTGNQGFEVAKEILASRVDFKKASVYDLNPQEFGTFDIVFFFGVLYHLKYPFLALEKIYDVTRDMLVLETHYDPYHSGNTPLATYYGAKDLDTTSWWGFNEACLLATLRTVGFKRMEILYRYADRIMLKAYKN
ncbi:MAG: DUF1698 domain-containing protein [Candidatus Nealsonbacteria bacterium]|nr:DUF1698 domain-containing protein [Candidatus Nealsonbacteria bacterium]